MVQAMEVANKNEAAVPGWNAGLIRVPRESTAVTPQASPRAPAAQTSRLP